MVVDEHYFNYISRYGFTGVQEGTDPERISADRVLEYTRSDLVEKLAKLDSRALQFLESIPTFLVSEIDDDNRIVIQFGHLSEISKTGRDIEFKFQLDVDFGTVEFFGAKEVAQIFGVNRFQPHRTHWAVAAGNPKEVLQRLQKKLPNIRMRIEEKKESAEPPKVDILGVASDVETFLGFVFNATSADGVEYFFRGHKKATYPLVPTVMREHKSGAPIYLPNEDLMAKELLISHYDEFQNDVFCFDRLVRMRHFGLPTRLLDISSNPLISLFFACEDGLLEDGQVLIFGVSKDKIKYYDSDTVSCLSNLSKLSRHERDNIDTSLDLEAFNDTPCIKKLWHHVCAEKAYFEKRIDPGHIGSIVCVKAKLTNNRIRSQHGAFLLFGHLAKMPADGLEGISIQRITVKNKREIKERLNRININASTVYPSIDKSAEEIMRKFEVRES
jgi:hypothetical protein